MSVIQDAPQRGPTPSRWLAPLAVGTILLVAGVAFFGGTVETSQDQATTTTTAPVPLAELVPGVAGTLHAVLDNPAGSNWLYASWSAEQSTPRLVELPAPLGRMNADASRIAALEMLSSGYGNLWAGPPDDLAVVSPDVTSFAWHDTDPTLIATTRDLSGIAQLWVGELDPELGFIYASIATLPDGSTVVGMGDWGFAIRIDDGEEVLILDGYGSLQRHYDGVPVGQRPGPSGGVVIGDGATIAPIAGWTSDDSQILIPAGGEVVSIGWSEDDGRIVASVDDAGSRVVRIIAPSGDLLSETPIDGQWVSWGPDGRFVIIRTDQGGVSLLDTTTSAATVIPFDGRVYDVALTPAT